MLFKNFRQDMRIADAQVDASAAARRAEAAHNVLEKLEERVARLALINEAMWNLLKAKTGSSDEDLWTEIHRIDAADEIIDGRRTPQAVKCHACNRNLPLGGRQCIYCGAVPPQTTPFEVL